MNLQIYIYIYIYIIVETEMLIKWVSVRALEILLSILTPGFITFSKIRDCRGKGKR